MACRPVGSFVSRSPAGILGSGFATRWRLLLATDGFVPDPDRLIYAALIAPRLASCRAGGTRHAALSFLGNCGGNGANSDCAFVETEEHKALTNMRK